MAQRCRLPRGAWTSPPSASKARPSASDLHCAVEIAGGEAATRRSSACAVSAKADDRKLCVGRLRQHERPSGEQQVDALADDQLADERDEHAPPSPDLLERIGDGGSSRAKALDGSSSAKREHRAAAVRSAHRTAASLSRLARAKALDVDAGRTETRARLDLSPVLLAKRLPQALSGVPGADEHRLRAGKTLAREAQEALGLGLDRVLERAAVHLHRVGRLLAERARQDHRPHHQMVGERHIGAHELGDLAHRIHVGLDVAGDLRVRAVARTSSPRCPRSDPAHTGQQTADVRAIDRAAGDARPLGAISLGSRRLPARSRLLLPRTSIAHELAAVPVPGGVDERLALGMAVLAKQVHLVAEPDQRVGETRVVDVGAGALSR